jgi:hypothetical protein
MGNGFVIDPNCFFATGRKKQLGRDGGARLGRYEFNPNFRASQAKSRLRGATEKDGGRRIARDFAHFL